MSPSASNFFYKYFILCQFLVFWGIFYYVFESIISIDVLVLQLILIVSTVFILYMKMPSFSVIILTL